MTTPRISVALATYNGDRFLRAQLQSLLEQETLPWELVIGDDGSTDSTVQILEDFAKESPFPVSITRNDTQLGYGDNFLMTASRCNGDWIAFCDQDDVWLPNKISDCANAICDEHRELSLILQPAYLTDEHLQCTGRRFPRTRTQRFYAANENFGFWVWPGFIKTVRSDIVRKVPFCDRPRSYFPREHRQSHDKWTCMIANAVGGILYLKEPAALYRRHSAALTGRYEKKPLEEKWAKTKRTGADHYEFLVDIANESAGCLEALAHKVASDALSAAFAESAIRFRKLAEVEHTRAALYRSRQLGTRMRYFLALWRRGGYIGHPFSALGSRSAFKDFVYLCRGHADEQAAMT